MVYMDLRVKQIRFAVLTTTNDYLPDRRSLVHALQSNVGQVYWRYQQWPFAYAMKSADFLVFDARQYRKPLVTSKIEHNDPG